MAEEGELANTGTLLLIYFRMRSTLSSVKLQLKLDFWSYIQFVEKRRMQARTKGILLPVSENGPGIGRSHDLKISSIWCVQL